MEFNPLVFRQNFPSLQSYVWLNTAGISPGASPVIDAMQAALDDWRNGEFDSHTSYEIAQDTRSCFAKLIGAEAESISLLPSAAAGASTIAASLAQQRSRGKIVVGEKEFRSNLFPWQSLADRGFVVDSVRGRDGVVSTEALMQAITNDTILVAVSDVQFAQGYRVDLEAVAQKARSVGARLFIDATQSLGVIRINLDQVQPDYLVAHGYKWLLCPRGMAWLYVASQHHNSTVPIAPSWVSVDGDPYDPMDGGSYFDDLSANAQRANFSPAWFLPAGAHAALSLLLNQAADGLEEHCLGLAQSFRDAAPEYGLTLAPYELPSHIIGVWLQNLDIAHTMLKSQKIITSVRRPYLRIGFHGFNASEDVEKALQSIAQASRSGG